jgi:hypothetical protein
MSPLRSRRARHRLLVIFPVICASLLYSATAALAAHAHPSKLITAARVAKQADRTFVRDAKRLQLCFQAHRSAPARRCAAVQRRLQRAGVRLARVERRLARIARSTSARTRASSASSGERQAPQLWVSGQKLLWSHVIRSNMYVLERLAPHQAAQYTVVYGTSVTPPPAPGEAVAYRVRTVAYGSMWSAWQSISYPAASKPPVEPPAPETPKVEPPTETPKVEPPKEEAPNTQAAPQLTLSGRSLTWNVVAGVNTYVLATRVSGKADQYSVITGTSFTPPTVAGSTVHYSVRTAVEGSAWSAEVSISYPAAPPVEEQPQESSNFEPGLNSGSDPTYDLPGSLQLGAKVVRLAFNLGETAQQIEPVVAEYANEGIRVAPMADFDNIIPTPAQAQGLAGWAQAFGPGGTFWAHRSDGRLAMRTIEFGNETSYSYQYTDHTPAGYASRAQSYAQRFAEAANAVKAVNPGVGMLAQGDAGNAGSVWVENMFKAVPNLGTLVAGWTIHPYGPGWRVRFQTLISQTAAQGAPATIPIDVTEWGLSSDNGNCVTENYGWGTCMTYQQAAETLTQSASEMHQMLGSRLGLLMLYQIRDQQRPGATNNREAYFGAVQHELQPKGAYTTAVKTLLAS